MKIDNSNSSHNNPSFQMRYMLKKYWNPDILKAVEESKLVKEIDSRFPAAQAYFDSFITDQRVNKTAVIIKLDKNITFKISAARKYINNPKEDFPAINKHLIERIQNASFEDVLMSIAKDKNNTKSIIEVMSKAVIFNKLTGINIKNKLSWNANVLDAFMNSNLAKDLGKDYPNTKISYKSSFLLNGNKHAAVIITNAKKQKSIIEVQSTNPVDDLIKKMKSVSIDDVSKDFENYKNIKNNSRSPFVKLLRKIFHNDK